MFRFFSFLSPNGTPDRAALGAAAEPPFRWDLGATTPTLHIPGVFCASLLFFRFEPSRIYIQEAGKVIKIPRETLASRFVVKLGPLKGLQASSLRVKTPSQPCEGWVGAAGIETNLVDFDRQFFGDLEASRHRLPLVNVHSSDPGLYAATPFPALPKFLHFLEKTEGKVSGGMKRLPEGWRIQLIAGKRSFESTFPEASIESLKAEAGVRLLTDGVISVKVDPAKLNPSEPR